MAKTESPVSGNPEAEKAGILSFKRVERAPRLSDVVAESILEGILSEGLKVGDSLPSERELCEQFDVSRTVVREATRALAARGIIEVRSGAGLRVAAVNADALASSMNLFIRRLELEYSEIHEVRTMIEVQVAGLAAARATDEDLERLKEVHKQMGEALDDVEALSLADVEFHRALASATHNELYLSLLDAMGDVMLEVRRRAVGRDPKLGGRGVSMHEDILQRVLKRDVDGARAAMQAHLEESKRIWSELTDSSSSGGD